MYAVLSRIMTGPAPDTREADNERRAGYVALGDVLTLIGQQTDRFEAAIESLKDTFHHDSLATRTLVEGFRSDTNRRLDALEAWKIEQELDEAIRRGFWHVVLLGVGKVATHWQLVWAIVFLVTTIIWRLTGTPTVGVGPVQP